MKVLEINSVCGYGSTGNIVVDLYHALREQGHECYVAYGRGKAPADVQTYRIGSELEVYVHGVRSRFTDMQAFYSTGATKRFVKWIKEYDPDVIHLHNLHGYYINVEVLFNALKQMDKPVVWTLHDCWAFTGHCAYYSSVNCYKWKKGCEYCPQKMSYPKSLLCDNSQSNFEKKKAIFKNVPKLTVVTPSQWLANEVYNSFLKDYSIRVIYNGIDLDIFKPIKGTFREVYQLEDKKIILGVANVWTKHKGLGIFNDLSKQFDDSYKIVLVGITKKQQSRLNKQILCIERTNSKKELAEIYTAADLFLNPSEEETMGLTTVEALACGTNVLVNDSTALPEIVDYDSSRIISNEEIFVAVENALVVRRDENENRDVASKFEKKQQYAKYLDLFHELYNRECK